MHRIEAEAELRLLASTCADAARLLERVAAREPDEQEPLRAVLVEAGAAALVAEVRRR